MARLWRGPSRSTVAGMRATNARRRRSLRSRGRGRGRPGRLQLPPSPLSVYPRRPPITCGAVIELQSHSTISDGQLPPGEVVKAAAEAEVTVLALSDHDAVAGVAAAAT